MQVKGKVAIVTGAASGIGLALVKELLRNEAKGVVMIDVNVVAAQKELEHIHKEFGDSRILFLQVDVSNRKQFEDAFETTVKTFHNLDIVINNAGIMNEVQWERCFSINLAGTMTGTMLAIEKYLPQYKSSDEAVVVNNSSICGIYPEDSLPAYTTSKFGVIGLTRCMGSEFRYNANNIKVIGICPASTDTNLPNFTRDQLPEPHYSRFRNIISGQKCQSSEVVAKHTMRLIESAPSGSIWTIVDAKCEPAVLTSGILPPT